MDKRCENCKWAGMWYKDTGLCMNWENKLLYGYEKAITDQGKCFRWEAKNGNMDKCCI